MALTPMMQQYREVKDCHKDCVVFFRLGDFYELFEDDAVEISKVLNLTLTKRQTTPMCGVPYHAAESYIGRLTRLGKKVAICEQLSDPSLPGIVKRGVTRIITPGTTLDDRILDQKAHHYIVSVAFGEHIGLAVGDVTTGLLEVTSLKNIEELRDELFRITPSECIVDAAEKNLPDFLKQFEKLPVFPHQFWEEPAGYVSKHFGVKNLEGFGISNDVAVLQALGLLLSYLKDTQKSDLAHLKPPRLMQRSNEMMLDETAIRNLELVSSLREGKREGSLLSVLDMTLTSMGGRMLRHWLLHPLHNKEEIEDRLDAVEELTKNSLLSAGLSEMLNGVLDLERLLARLTIGTGNARDLLGVALSLKGIEKAQELLSTSQISLLKKFHTDLVTSSELKKVRNQILTSLLEAPPLSIKEGGLIKEGISRELDELRMLSRQGKDFLEKLQQREIAATGINSLKVRFNNIFGYYIEITKANLHLAPQHYIRKQTTVNAERFITPELKEYEEKILGAEAKMKELEYQIFLKLREDILAHTRIIQSVAEIFGTLDVLLSLAQISQKNRYARPTIAEANTSLEIKNGRHPVVEHLAGGEFIPNDTELTNDARLLLLSGPNMGGKSTYLRQVALIALLAHVGSFVPAEKAQIPLIDRIFTRVGASDNLVRGQSTFMVEMQETAQILHYATQHSLIILDEIGRGTSTYDGVSLAWAILEYIHNVTEAKTLFATHYHELINVAEKLPHALNVSVAVKEENDRVVFLYRVLKGAIDKSYGIEVARLAGLPKEIISQAKKILVDLEEGIVDSAIATRIKEQQTDKSQLDLFNDRPHRAIEELKKVDINSLTPLEALKKLDELKKIDR